MRNKLFLKGLSSLSIFSGIETVLGDNKSKEPGSVTLKVLYPPGVIEVTQLHATRLPDLNGKTICELSNARWGTERTFPAIRQLLQKRFPDAKIIPYNELLSGKRQIESAEQIGDMILEKGGQAVITGNSA